MAATRATADMDTPMNGSASLSPNKASTCAVSGNNHGVIDVALRAVVFAFGLAAIIVMVTGKQSKMIPIAPGMVIPWEGNWNLTPAYINYIVSFSVACLYSIITGVSSVLELKKKTEGDSTNLLFHILDSLLLGIVSSALGAALSVGYVGLKGNYHSRWNKICDTYDTFCHHIFTSITLAFISSIALLLLVWLSFYSLSKKIARP